MLARIERRIGSALEFAAGRGALIVCLLVAVSATLFPRLGAAPVERNSELRCHEVARGMVATGDYVVPRFDGEVRLQKPPLYYWLASASAVVMGTEPTLGTTRFPSAVAALALALLVFWWGRSLGGTAHGLLAVTLLLLMLQFTTSGRRGDAEMTLALWSTAALFAFERWSMQRTAGRLATFAACLALAFLSKATVAFVTVLLPIVVAAFAERRARDLRSPRFLGAVVAAIVVGFAWYAVVLARVPNALDSLLGDAVLPVGVKTGAASGAEHFLPPWYFLDKIWGVAAPASLLIPVAVWRGWRTRLDRGDARRRFAAIAFLAMFVVFSILPQKQRHYLLPTLPFLALALADSARAFAVDAPRGFARFLRGVGSALGAIGLAGVVVFSIYFTKLAPEYPITRFVLLPIAGIAFVLQAVAAIRVLPRANVTLLVIAVTALLYVYNAHVKVFALVIDEAVEAERAAPDEDHVIAVADESPWLMKVLDVEKNVRKIRERRAEGANPR